MIGEDEGREIFNDESSSIELHHSLYGNAPGDIVEGGGFEATNSLTDNPLLLRLWGGNLRLSDASPAIDAGDPDTDLALFPTDEDGDPIDLDGNPRVIGGFIDIGAFERQEEVAERRQYYGRGATRRSSNTRTRRWNTTTGMSMMNTTSASTRTGK